MDKFNMDKFFEKPLFNRRNRELDLLAVGELLVDFISNETVNTLATAENFHRYPGGSPANLAANMSKLGNKSALIASVGSENMGVYLKNKLEETGVITDYIVTNTSAPTSIVLISRSSGTADFIAYRASDTLIMPENIKDEILKRSSIYHTTCFALSKEPAQSSIINGAKRAAKLGCKLSLDANYAPSIWADRNEARQIISEYCNAGAMVKISLDDIFRLFEETNISPEKAMEIFFEWGADLVCLTLGKNGSMVSVKNDNIVNVPAKKSIVADATGAGDAYWAAFLTAWLDGYSVSYCAAAGSNLAAKKLSVVGPLPDKINRDIIYHDYE